MDWESFYSSFRKPDFIPGYEIQNRLGGGAFGEVFKARKHSIGKSYAIKFLKVDDDAQREALERELEQVRHFAAIDHPNLVTIEDLGTVLGVPYLIMGYAGEETLARRLRQGELDQRSALSYFVQISRGVLALHDRRLVHFDLKPGNVFLKGDIARVGDYGLSKLMTSGRLTLSFGRGTPHYMAPEILRSRADHRADIYSLGVILYECYTRRVPFEAASQAGLVLREEDLPPVFPPDFPAELRPVVERCLRLDPSARYPSVEELLAELEQTSRPGDSIRFELGAPLELAGRALPPAPTPRGQRAPPRTADARVAAPAGSLGARASGRARSLPPPLPPELARRSGAGPAADPAAAGAPLPKPVLELPARAASRGSPVKLVLLGPLRLLGALGRMLRWLGRGLLFAGGRGSSFLARLLRALLSFVLLLLLGAGITLLLLYVFGAAPSA